MTNRIKINAVTFKISKQSYDVNSATADQLLFDGFNAAPYAGVLFSGTESVVWSSRSPVSGWTFTGSTFTNDFRDSERWLKDITFSSKGITQSLTSPPEVIYMVKRSSGNTASPSYSYAERGTFGTAASDWSGGAIWASTSTTALTLRMDKSIYSNNMPTDFVISYVVFQTFQGLPGLTPA
jgi:hypothetical protein